MDVIIDVTEIIIKTNRLILRSWKETDLDDFFAYASILGVGEMAGWPHHETIETSKQILRSFMEKKEVFALYHKNNRKVIGSLGLHRSWANEDDKYKTLKIKEIGYVLSKDYWGQGLIPEAMNAVIKYCSINYDVEAFTCGHFKENNQSRRVIEKCGFKFIKESEYYSEQLDKSFEDKKYILIRRDADV
jgi:ribosomal-protein-alanine N-acetyltransferase